MTNTYIEPIFEQTVRAIFDEKNAYTEDMNVINLIKMRFETHVRHVVKLSVNFQRQNHEKRITVDAFNESLRVLNHSSLLGYRRSRAIKYTPIGELDNAILCVPEDKQIDINQYINQMPLPTPIEKFFSFHWLSCLKGVQPQIPENITEHNKELTLPISQIVAPNKMKLTDQPVHIITTRNEIDKDLYAKYMKVFQNPEGLENICRDLEHDSAITPLLPYINAELSNPYAHLMELFFRIKISQALLRNQYISTDLFLQNFITLGITAVIDTNFDIFGIKDLGARFLSEIVNKFQDSYPGLRERLADHFAAIFSDKRIVSFFDKRQSPIQRKIGAAMALYYLGPEIVRHQILPKIPEFLDRINQMGSDGNKLKAILLKLSGDCFNYDTRMSIEKNGTPQLPENLRKMYNSIAKYFGMDFFIYSAR